MQQEMESSLDESECEERDLFIPQLPNVESVASSALPSGLSGLDQFVNTWRSQSVAYWRLTLAEIKTNRVGYVLGFLACLVVVMVVGLASSVLTRFPLMFAKFAELDNGQVDVILRPRNEGTLDYPRFVDLISNAAPLAQTPDGQPHLLPAALPQYSLNSARMSFWSTVVAKASDCAVELSSYSLTNYSWVYTGASPQQSNSSQAQSCAATSPASAPSSGDQCFRTLCPEAQEEVFLSVIDSQREWAMDLGRAMSSDQPMGRQQCMVSDGFAAKHRLATGDRVLMSVDLNELVVLWPTLRATGLSAGPSQAVPVSPTPNATNAGERDPLLDRVVLQLVVSRVFPVEDNPKYAKDNVASVVIEYATLFQEFAAHLHPATRSEVRAALNGTDPYQFAESILVNFLPPRLDVYTNANIDQMHEEVLAFVSPLAHLLHYEELSIRTPIFRMINNTLRWMSLFLGLIMNLIIFVLLLLSVILIYSLLMTSVESRTFQVGILRMVGMRRHQLVQFLVFQALSFSVPSILIGLPLAQILSYFVSALFVAIADVKMDVSITLAAIGYAVLLGVSVPIISSLIPIRRALAHNLHAAIDVRRSGLSATKVVLERSTDDRVSPSMIVISLLLLLFGFSIYYLFPLALVSTNIALLLNIFFILLLMMLFGLVMISINFQSAVEQLLIFLFFFWEKPTIPQILKKNLMAHRRRNKLTTILYSISLAFIVFLLVSYDVQIQSLLISRNQRHGTLLTVQASSHFTPDEMTALTAWSQAQSRYVAEVSWVSNTLAAHLPNLSYQGVSNLGRIYKYPTSLRTCSPNFFSTSLPGFLVPRYYDAAAVGGDLLGQLYRPSQNVLVMIGAAFHESLSLDIGSQLLLQVETSANKSLFVSEVSSMLDSAPFFSFSQYAIMASRQDTMVSIPTFAKLAGLNSVDQVMFETMLIRFTQDAVPDAVLDAYIEQIAAISPSISSWDARSGLDTIQTVNTVVSLFFGTAIIIAMLISCFSLTSSMMTNIWEQSKEIGVLRAIGLPNLWTMRIYIYESFLVVLSSSIIGILIGTIIGWTMSLQRVLFTNLPIPFSFPLVPLIITFVASLFFAFIASYSPIKALTRNTIVHNMRLLS